MASVKESFPNVHTEFPRGIHRYHFILHKTLLVLWCNGEDGGKGETSVKVKELHMSIFDD